MSKILLFAVIILIVFALLAALPAITINADAVISSSAFSYIRAAMYFIPAGTCASILAIIMGLQVWRIIVSLVKTIWELLPISK